MAQESRLVPIRLSDGTEILVEATVEPGAPGEIGVEGVPSFDDIAGAVRGIGKDLIGAIRAVGPNKATVEIKLSAKYESGKVLAILLKGAADASLTVTLEWGGE
jgi:hypothetical protein